MGDQGGRVGARSVRFHASTAARASFFSAVVATIRAIAALILYERSRMPISIKLGRQTSGSFALGAPARVIDLLFCGSSAATLLAKLLVHAQSIVQLVFAITLL